jgi:UDP-glucose 4-epimerase
LDTAFLVRIKNQVEIYNIGSEDQTTAKTIAETVIKEMKLELTGGVDSGRAGKAMSKNMQLDITKNKTLGWKPKHSSKQAIRKATKHVITELESI